MPRNAVKAFNIRVSVAASSIDERAAIQSYAHLIRIARHEAIARNAFH
jgi:hypothetical protein